MIKTAEPKTTLVKPLVNDVCSWYGNRCDVCCKHLLRL